jgi:hypothetical protein
VLARDNVFNMETKIGITVLIDVTVFAPVTGAVANEVCQRGIHVGSSGRG